MSGGGAGMFYETSQDAVIRAVEDRVASVTHIPKSHQERMQALNYHDGQKYSPHHVRPLQVPMPLHSACTCAPCSFHLHLRLIVTCVSKQLHYCTHGSFSMREPCASPNIAPPVALQDFFHAVRNPNPPVFACMFSRPSSSHFCSASLVHASMQHRLAVLHASRVSFFPSVHNGGVYGLEGCTVVWAADAFW